MVLELKQRMFTKGQSKHRKSLKNNTLKVCGKAKSEESTVALAYKKHSTYLSVMLEVNISGGRKECSNKAKDKEETSGPT